MGIQAMHNDTGFLLDQLWGLDHAVQDSSRWGFNAFNSPFCIMGAVMGFLKIPFKLERL